MGINKQKYYDYVVDFFANNNCELLTTFENFVDRYESNLSFRCACGNIVEDINFKWFSRARHKVCKVCQKIKNPRKNIEYKNIVSYFKNNGCTLLTSEADYVNSYTKNIKYKCKCGSIVENESYQLYFLSTYKCCHDCRECVREHRYTPFKEVEKTFSSENIELLTKEP